MTDLSLRLAFDSQFAPLTFLEHGRPAGRAIDIVRRASAKAGIRIAFSPVSSETQVWPAGGATRGLDGFVCMAVTDARTADFRFSVPYLPGRAALFWRVDREPIQADRLDGLLVATPRSGPLFSLLSNRPHGPRVLPTHSYHESLLLVWQGAADAAALNAEVGWHLAQEIRRDGFVPMSAPFPELLGLAVALLPESERAEEVLARLDPALAATLSPPAAPGP
ncbi:MAG: transporter substrate-binding domain-containing protein [Gaiellales bacterium]|nr:transporter substrate-binding domain-containing protein [Gaiellales bacterium]